MNGQYHAPVAFLQAKQLRTHWTGGCVGPGAGVHDFGEEKIFTKLVTECDNPDEWVSPVIVSSNLENLCLKIGVRGGAVGSGTALQAGMSRVRFPMLSLEFFIDIILPDAVDSASNRD